MKIEKMSLRSIKNVLSRAEMKKIMAGSCGIAGFDNYYCCTSAGSGSGMWLGYISCQSATSGCAGMVTNNESRC